MSEHTYSVDSLNGGVDVTRLFKEIDNAGHHVAGVSFNNDGTEIIVVSNASQSEIDSVVNDHEGPDSLACYKAKGFALIDSKTGDMINNGFQYSGKIFSLSQNAQSKMMGINQIRDDPEVVYPIKWNTKDDNDYYEVQNSSDMRGFYLTGVGTYRVHVDAGTTLKDAIRAATSKAEVDAVIDPR